MMKWFLLVTSLLFVHALTASVVEESTHEGQDHKGSFTLTTAEEEITEQRADLPATRAFIPPKPACYKDKQCGFKRFCHRHFGRCENCKRERQLCRRKAMCCKGMECRYGICSMPVKYGRIGSKCKADRDCDGDTCCAKTWGRNVCKPRLAKGYQCSPPEGGLSWSLNSHCQCQTGLMCLPKMEDVQAYALGYVVVLPWKLTVYRCHSYKEFMLHQNQTIPTPST